jgi:hypothetical protein
LALILFALGQIAATCQGTETGNPGVPSDNPGGGTGGSTGGENCLVVSKRQTGSDIAVDDLISALCSKIILCGVPTTTDTCFNALNGPDGDLMTDELGLAAGEFTIAELRQALIDGTLSADTESVSSCEAAIGSVDCASVEANVSSADFSGAENVIPSACLAVFADADAAPSFDDCPY